MLTNQISTEKVVKDHMKALLREANRSQLIKEAKEPRKTLEQLMHTALALRNRLSIAVRIRLDKKCLISQLSNTKVTI